MQYKMPDKDWSKTRSEVERIAKEFGEWNIPGENTLRFNNRTKLQTTLLQTTLYQELERLFSREITEGELVIEKQTHYYSPGAEEIFVRRL